MSNEPQLFLSPDLPRAGKTPPPWRRSVFESWPEETIPGEKLYSIYIDFLARNRQLLKALERARVPADTPGLERFLKGDQALLGQYALHRLQNGPEQKNVAPVRQVVIPRSCGNRSAVFFPACTDDLEWKLTAVFCMKYLPDFEDEIRGICAGP